MNRETLIAFIKEVSGHENIIAVPRVFVELTQDWGVAAMLNQLIYWSSRTKNKDGYIYKSLDDWQTEVGGVTRYTINKLRDLPFVETELKKANGAPTLHYRVDFDILVNELSKVLKMDLPKITNQIDNNSNSLTETTTEITTNIKRIQATPGMSLVEWQELNRKAEEEKKANNNSHKAVVGALMEVTGLDMKIKTNAGRIYKASKELRDAGYGVDDIMEFGRQWKRDWRFKQDGKPPIPETILKEICHIEREDSVEERKRIAFEQIEKARQTRLENGG